MESILFRQDIAKHINALGHVEIQDDEFPYHLMSDWADMYDTDAELPDLFTDLVRAVITATSQDIRRNINSPRARHIAECSFSNTMPEALSHRTEKEHSLMVEIWCNKAVYVGKRFPVSKFFPGAKNHEDDGLPRMTISPRCIIEFSEERGILRQTNRLRFNYDGGYESVEPL